MKKLDYLIILTTAASRKEAQKIARKLLKEKKAACVNIIPGVDSHFFWKGRLEKAKEYLLLVKTKSCHLKQITELIKKTHSYEVPEIIALPVKGGSKSYLQWIDEVLEGEKR